ncbi:MAG: transglutaminase domain-containing protein, partial [Terrimesophilobacter sp.]
NGTFGYSETAPETEGYDGTGMENIAKFLVAKNGYCVHFASAMAVMARTLSIPSRVAVGFLPGEPDGAKIQGQVNYRVTTKNVHSCPELYFDGVGWVRFEPTPGRGFVPDYANVETPGVPVPPVVPTATPTPEPSATTTPSAAAAPTDPLDPASPAAQDSKRQAWLWLVLVITGIAGLLLVPAGVRVVQRLVRLHRMSLHRPLAGTLWRELLQSAEDLGLRIPVGATPRQAAAMIGRAARLAGTDAEALWRIRRIVETESFASNSLTVSPESSALRETNAADLQRVVDSLRAAARLRTRLRAALAPPSIWHWMSESVRPAPSRSVATPAG